jgi:F-type H+-transporting ATPase subunit epsilon
MKCDVVSAHRKIHSGEIAMLVASGVSGELGIMPGHAPLITTLRAGTVRVIDKAGEESAFVIGGGILEVMPHLVTVLVDSAVRAADFDIEAARRARRHAEQELKQGGNSMEIAEAQALLKRTIEQMRALEEWRRRVEHRK